ncbi:XRE family transcriptional regulator [Candidatus Pristimantibacillus sp. PTI5]|uniref:XRE family transcriptional regulator n=1 Tax=Candidatus Pristimantibacillus sp. PTI5 TaxID=3400422 RepID=UPI003B0205B0
MYCENAYERLMNQQKDVLVFIDSLPQYAQIKVKRVYDGFTQVELAEKLGMGAPFLCEIEKGHRNIPRKYKDAIESYLYSELYEERELVEKID